EDSRQCQVHRTVDPQAPPRRVDDPLRGCLVDRADDGDLRRRPSDRYDPLPGVEAGGHRLARIEPAHGAAVRHQDPVQRESRLGHGTVAAESNPGSNQPTGAKNVRDPTTIVPSRSGTEIASTVVGPPGPGTRSSPRARPPEVIASSGGMRSASQPGSSPVTGLK